jgi:DNA invertase Pin-like site-specific DNA recombinase
MNFVNTETPMTGKVAPMSTNALYLRISQDSDGHEAGVERQREDALMKAEEYGADISEDMIFVDNDISASTLSTKPRPKWNRLVELIEAGQVTQVFAYSSSRLTRRPRDMEDLIDLYNKTGVLFRTSVSGDYDLATADGREQARNKASRDAAEAERTSERVIRQKRQRAMKGKPQGGRTRLYGYTSKWELVPDEAEVIKEAFTRRAAGESINSIAVSLAGRGITTAEFTCKWHTERFEHSGKERPEDIPATREECDKCRPGQLWRTGTLISTLKNPTYAGLRSYKKAIVGPMREGFPAIIDEPTYYKAQDVTAEKPKSANSRKYLLSGFARCGKCMGRMVGATNNQRASRYRCSLNQGGCGALSIRQDWVDEPVYMAVVAHEISARYMTRDTTSEDASTANDAEVERIQADLKTFQEGVVNGTISGATAMPVIEGLEQQLSKARSAQRKAVTANVKDAWFGRTTTELLGLSVGEQRALMAKHIEYVRVDAAKVQGSKALDLSRLELHYTDGTVERLSNTVASHPDVNPLDA